MTSPIRVSSLHSRWTLPTAVAVVLSAGVAWTCCMVPLSYPGDVDQARQDAVIFHHNGTQDLIARVQPVFPEGEKGPDKLMWILTLPSKPKQYAEVDGRVFEDAEKLAKSLAEVTKGPDRRRGIDEKSEPESGSIEVSAPIRVGPFEITEVRAADGKSEAGARALNEFLAKRGYPAESVEELEWFTSRDFTFLCVQVFPPTGKTHFSSKIETPALRVTFDTKRIYYPAKYSARQGNFALGLTVLSSLPLDRASMRDAKRKLKSIGSVANMSTRKVPGKLGELISETPRLAKVSTWYVTALPSHGFNPAKKGDVGTIASWKDDVFLSLIPPRSSGGANGR
ncbi:MAG: hypothetical protein AAF488_08145 [Planctomycetota bacterium]